MQLASLVFKDNAWTMLLVLWVLVVLKAAITMSLACVPFAASRVPGP